MLIFINPKSGGKQGARYELGAGRLQGLHALAMPSLDLSWLYLTLSLASGFINIFLLNAYFSLLVHLGFLVWLCVSLSDLTAPLNISFVSLCLFSSVFVVHYDYLSLSLIFVCLILDCMQSAPLPFLLFVVYWLSISFHLPVDLHLSLPLNLNLFLLYLPVCQSIHRICVLFILPL